MSRAGGRVARGRGQLTDRKFVGRPAFPVRVATENRPIVLHPGGAITGGTIEWRGGASKVRAV